jgi:hypothetical protein
MTERSVTLMNVRSKLVSEPDGPYAQHTGQNVIPTADENGNLWVVLAVGNGSGSGTTTTLESSPDDADNRPAFSQPLIDANGLAVVNHPFLYDGSVAPGTWDRARSASAINQALQSGTGAALAVGVGEWAITHTPAAATKATITKAAVAGTSHVCKGISFTFNAIAAEAGTFLINLRDGASGAGTILQSWRVGPFAVGGSMIFGLTDLNIPGTAGNDMTLEFATAPAAGNFETVSLRGYDAT